MKINKNISIL